LKHVSPPVLDPVEDGGLGLDPPTVAQMVGHDDGGYLIATVYTKLAERRAYSPSSTNNQPLGGTADPPGIARIG
jgi:hypothetical protein